jgi:hypothetical protein
VSLLSRERIIVGLAPERLTALWVGGWLRPRLLDRHAVLLPPQGTAGWEAGIATLETLFTETAWRGRDVAVVLSAHYVRHVLVPAGRGIGEEERLALATAVFQETFGDLARDWELRVSPAAGDAATLACGVPRALLAALRTACQGRGRLVSVQPSLMPVFKRVRQAIGKAAGSLALVETGRITIASVENGQWKYIDSRAGDGAILPQFLLEEGAVHGRQPGGILWLCDLTNSARLPAGSFWSHQPIEPPHLPGMDPGVSLATWGLA